jgi:multimeric flavodoxin WrbA
MTYVLALNSSPNGDTRKSGTATILNHFLDGMREAGAEIDVFNLAEMEISPCKGCMACWWKTPGKCVEQDDMNLIYPKLKKADVLVLATPLYVDGMNAQLKAAVDRFLPLVKPFFEVRDDHCRHPRREEVTGGRLVLVSVCGFHELDNFDALVTHAQAICRNMDREFSGAVLRPYAKIFPFLKMKGVDVDSVYRDVRRAGVELIQEGKLTNETQARIGRDLVSRNELIDGMNSFFKRSIQAGTVFRKTSNLITRIKGEG